MDRPRPPSTARSELPAPLARAAGTILLVLLCAAGAGLEGAAAQSLQGTLLARGSDDPIAGAFATLRRADGSRVDAGLTGEHGGFVLRADARGRYRLRVERIGFETWTSEAFELSPGSTLRRRFRVPVEPVSLETLSVRADRRCGTDLSGARAAGRLWTEARKALDVRAWSESRRRYRFDTRRRVRVEARDPPRVILDSTRTWSGVSGTPFRSAPAESLAAHGWVQPDGGSHLYYGPDAGALLADAFRRTHCFSVTDPTRAAQHLAPSDSAEGSLVGLSFEPAPGRSQPDIRGVLWLDRSDGALRELAFRYTWIPADASPAPYGGRIWFRRLESGAWIVERWRLRAPNVTNNLVRTPGATLRHRSPNRVKVVESRVLAIHSDTAASEDATSEVDAGSAAMRLHRAGFLERRRERRGRFLGPGQLRELTGTAARDRIRKMWSWARSGCEAGASLWVDGERRRGGDATGPLATGEVILAVEAYEDRLTTPAAYRTAATCGAMLLWTAGEE